jgi:hypothetical protein
VACGIQSHTQTIQRLVCHTVISVILWKVPVIIAAIIGFRSYKLQKIKEFLIAVEFTFSPEFKISS